MVESTASEILLVYYGLYLSLTMSFLFVTVTICTLKNLISLSSPSEVRNYQLNDLSLKRRK